ncbi:MAG: GtrA family protein [Ferrimicrobium sp.]
MDRIVQYVKQKLGARFPRLRALWSRMWRYAAGSIISLIISQLVFLSLFSLFRVAGSHNSSIIATLSGMVPSYFLNRNWAWGRRTRSSLHREIIPYVLMAVIGLLFSTWSADFSNSHPHVLGPSRIDQDITVQGAYFASFAILWFGKFAFMQRWLFAPPKVEIAES